MHTRQFITCENKVVTFRQPLHSQVDKATYPGRLSSTATVIDEQIETVGHMLKQQRYQTPAANQRSGNGDGNTHPIHIPFSDRNNVQIKAI